MKTLLLLMSVLCVTGCGRPEIDLARFDFESKETTKITTDAELKKLDGEWQGHCSNRALLLRK